MNSESIRVGSGVTGRGGRRAAAGGGGAAAVGGEGRPVVCIVSCGCGGGVGEARMGAARSAARSTCGGCSGLNLSVVESVAVEETGSSFESEETVSPFESQGFVSAPVEISTVMISCILPVPLDMSREKD